METLRAAGYMLPAVFKTALRAYSADLLQQADLGGPAADLGLRFNKTLALKTPRFAATSSPLRASGSCVSLAC